MDPGKTLNSGIVLDRLKDWFYKSEFQRAIELHDMLDEPSAEADYWGAYALYANGQEQEAKPLFEEAFARGHAGAGALLANLSQKAGNFKTAGELLHALEPYEALSFWDQAVVHRERGNLFEALGEFREARDAYRLSWNILRHLPEGLVLFGQVGQLLAQTHELLGESQDTLKVVRQTKHRAHPDAAVELIYHEVIAAIHLKDFSLAEETGAELEGFRPRDPYLQALIHQALGTLAHHMGQPSLAIPHFQVSAKVFGDSLSDLTVPANLYMGNCFFQLQNIEQAKLYYNKADNELVNLWPSLSPSHRKRAQAELFLHIGALNIALQENSGFADLHEARTIFEELRLPYSQILVWQQLAQWELSKLLDTDPNHG